MMNMNQIKTVAATLILACSPLFAHAEDQGDLRSRHPDARNDGHPEMMRGRAPVIQHREMVKRHRMAKQHRVAMHKQDR